jgi:hypothetical protein
VAAELRGGDEPGNEGEKLLRVDRLPHGGPYWPVDPLRQPLGRLGPLLREHVSILLEK